MLLGNVPCLGVHGDDREAHLQDPAVHDFAHRERQLDGRLIVHSLGQSRMGQLSAGPRLSPHPGSAAPAALASPQGCHLAGRQWRGPGLGGGSWGPGPFCLPSAAQSGGLRISQPLVCSTLMKQIYGPRPHSVAQPEMGVCPRMTTFQPEQPWEDERGRGQRWGKPTSAGQRVVGGVKAAPMGGLRTGLGSPSLSSQCFFTFFCACALLL